MHCRPPQINVSSTAAFPFSSKGNKDHNRRKKKQHANWQNIASCVTAQSTKIINFLLKVVAATRITELRVKASLETLHQRRVPPWPEMGCFANNNLGPPRVQWHHHLRKASSQKLFVTSRFTTTSHVRSTGPRTFFAHSARGHQHLEENGPTLSVGPESSPAPRTKCEAHK